MKKDQRNKDPLSLKDYINMVRSHFITFLIITFTCLVISVVYAVNARDIYKSTTTLKISRPSGSILKSPLLPEFQEFGTDRFILNELEILKSYTIRERVANAVIDSFKVNVDKMFYQVYETDPGIIKSDKQIRTHASFASLLKKILSIDQKRGLDIAEISVESPSAYEASLIANCYANIYRNFNLEINRNQLTMIKKFLKEQRNEKQSQLAEAEEVLRTFQEKGGIIALDLQAENLIEQIASFDAKKSAAFIEMNSTEKVSSHLRSELRKQNPEMADYLKTFADES